jgi:23S rRNA (uridine2552-2'-O)-methyltransferase
MEFAMQHMKPKGMFLVKVFQGSGFSEFMGTMRSTFKQVLSRKPKASRDRSSELYLLGKDLIEKSV